MTTIAIIGLGEAGRIYAEAFRDAGLEVVGFDAFKPQEIAGVAQAASAVEAVTGADFVLSLTQAAAAAEVAAQCLPAMGADAVYVDMTSSGPHDEKAMAALPRKADFVDVAILGPVITEGAATPLMLSGQGSAKVAELFGTIGAPVDDIGGEPGDAMAHKLIRSILTKGFASVVCEALLAGEAAGFPEWTRGQAIKLLNGGEVVVNRYEKGTRKHAARRAQEMSESAAFVASLGVPTIMAEAAAEAHRWHRDQAAAQG